MAQKQNKKIVKLSADEYEAIEAAVNETVRGRAFLDEYAKRNKVADTTQILNALSALEAAMANKPSGDTDRLRYDILEMANAIAKTKAEIASIKPDDESGRIGDATEELGAIVHSTEHATSEILSAAEHIQEVAWTLREENATETLCSILDQRATDIYTACSFQDITGQRTSKVINVLQFLEDRINAMMNIWDVQAIDAPQTTQDEEDALLNGPARLGEGLEQSDVDSMMRDIEIPGFEGFETIEVTSEDIVQETPQEAPQAKPEPSKASLINKMDPIDRVALFS